MLSFILGSPGSGKTNAVIHRVRCDLEKQNKVLVIVPEQNILSCERAVSSAIPACPEIMNLEVVSFRRFCNTVFRALGGLCYNYLDKGGQAVLMWRALSELAPDLNTFKPGASTDIGLVSSLVGLYDQFSDYNVKPIDLENAVYSLKADLVPKAEDIATLYTRYDELIHDGFDSAKDDLIRAAELLSVSEYLNGTCVYLDSFTSFTPAEYKLLEVIIGKADSVTVTLCMDITRDNEIFTNLIDTKRRLERIAEKYGVSFGADTVLKNERTTDLAFLEKYCYDSYSGKIYEDEPENITLVSTPDIYTECELVCADIQKQIRSGMRYRDISVVMGDMSRYQGILDTLFKRHGIPCHFSTKEDIIQKPIVKLIVSALNIITYNWRLGDVISYIKTGLCGISPEECDIIEEYASTWSVSGSMWKLESVWNMNPDGYTDRTDIYTADKLVRINDIRDRLRDPILRLADSVDGRTSADKCARALYTFITETVDTYLLDDTDTAAYNALILALEQLCSCGGDIEIGDLETLKRLIRLLTSQTDFSLIPATVDQINCTSVSSLKSEGLKKCYILGAVDGCFPGIFKENTILNDELRAALCEHNISLPNDPEELSYNELYSFWRGALSAKKLYISYYTGSLDGAEILPSACIYELKKLFPSLNEKTAADFDIYDLMYDHEAVFDRINDKNYAETVTELLSDDSKYADVIKALDIPVTTTLCSVNDPENLELFSGDINLTQTRVESFVKCSFAYQLNYVLKLNEQRKVEYDPRDIGNFIHSLLEEFFASVRDAEKQGREIDDAETEAIVTRLVDAYLERTCGSVLKVSRRMMALFARLKRQALVFVHSIFDEFKNSDFKPVLFEVPISRKGDAGISPFRVQLSDGNDIYIYGTIDRVDTYEKDGNVYFRIVDYKTGSKSFKRSDLEKGLNLQMFLYMFSVMENKEKFGNMIGCKGELVPAGALYYIAKLPTQSHELLLSAEEAERDVISHIERSGMLLDDDAVIKAMSKAEGDIPLPKGVTTGSKANSEEAVYTLESLNDIKNDVTNTLIRIADGLKKGSADAVPMEEHSKKSPCEYCRMRPICRHTKKGELADE